MAVPSVVQLGPVQHAQEQRVERVVGLLNFVEENEGIGEFGVRNRSRLSCVKTGSVSAWPM